MTDERINYILANIQLAEDCDWEECTREERQWMRDFRELAEAYRGLQYRTEQT